MTDDEKIGAYFAAKDEVHNLFLYVKDWVEIPMDDHRGEYWMLTNGEGRGSTCVYSDDPLTDDALEKGEIYSGPIYTQRFLNKWVYRSERHVMVAVDTQTDGNKFLMIFDADKECTVPDNDYCDGDTEDGCTCPRRTGAEGYPITDKWCPLHGRDPDAEYKK